jgi:DNA-binding response OmpR family regulator
MEEVLSKQYDVYTLSSAAFMFSLLNNIVPDLIILDLLMPEINGFETLKRLKEDKRYAGIPVVILTGKGDAATEALGLEMGAVDFIRKPFSTPVLLDRLIVHLDV